jgi:hypothetical protein
VLLPRTLPAQTVLVTEEFDDTSFASRGWYDTNGGALSTVEHLPGSAASYECRFAPGAMGCAGGSPGRHLFAATESVYLSFHIKHSASWVGSGQPYHPHMFYFLTDQNDAYVGPAYTHLTAYIEENQGFPQLALQDGENIDEAKIGQNLIGVTESRSVAGCNGVATNIGVDSVDCYVATGSTHWNGVVWKGPSPWFFDSTPGPTSKSDWHLVEAYFQLNTVSSGIGNADGVVQYWYDGTLVIDHHDVILRTGQLPTMKFNQLLLGFYIGDGSPADQTLWIDRLTIATGRPGAPPPPPDAGAQKEDAAPPLPGQDAALPPPLRDAGPSTRDGAALPLGDGRADLPPGPGRDATSRPRADGLSGGCGCGAAGSGEGVSFWWILPVAWLWRKRIRGTTGST